MRPPSNRAGFVQGVRWYFAEERPGGPPPKPFLLTYLGSGVEEVPGVGLFQHGTTAAVDRAVAERYRDRAGWQVVARVRDHRAD
ncbi:MAG: hypothetical protein KatS3mg102_1572 [Planctomycetota bacterium]|nr:MAG: hypothetical protein KatS3mg102_1572 [Planctomycetota bacterium]